MASNADYKNIYAPASSRYYYILSIYWEEQNYSIDGNYSTIWGRARLESKGIGFSGEGVSCLYLYWHDNHTNTDTLINSVIPSTMSTNATFDVTGSLNVAHNDDGSLTGYAYAKWVKRSNNNYVPASDTIATGWTALTTIPRASSISASNTDIESPMNINISKASSNFTTTVTYSFGSLSGTIATQTYSTNFNWTVPSSFYSQIPNSKAGVGALYAYTYLGNTLVGTKSCTFVVTANETKCKPSIEMSCKDINESSIALTKDDNKIIKYTSNVLCTFANKIVKNSASISNIILNGMSIGNVNEFTINNTETNTFTVTLVDSRGYASNPYVITLDMVDYIKVSLDATFERNQPTDGKVNLSYSGNYYNGSFGNEDNSLEVKYRYRKQEEAFGDYITLNPIIEDNTFSQEIQLENFDYESNFYFEILAIDKINQNGYKVEALVVHGIPVYWWNKTSFNTEVPLYVEGKSLLDMIHPVGSIYLTLDNTNPSTLFGGTWEQISQGRTLLGAGTPVQNNYSGFGNLTNTELTYNFGGAGSMGGEYSHQLSVNEMPSHNHNIGYRVGDASPGSEANTHQWANGYTFAGGNYSDYVGGNVRHNNIQPYFVVYIWKRIS